MNDAGACAELLKLAVHYDAVALYFAKHALRTAETPAGEKPAGDKA